MSGHLSMALYGALHRDPARSQSREEAVQKTQALPGLCSWEGTERGELEQSVQGTKRGDLEQSVQRTTLELVLPSTESPAHLSLLPPGGTRLLPPEGAPCGRSSLEPVQGRNWRRVPSGASCKSPSPWQLFKNSVPQDWELVFAKSSQVTATQLETGWFSSECLGRGFSKAAKMRRVPSREKCYPLAAGRSLLLKDFFPWLQVQQSEGWRALKPELGPKLLLSFPPSGSPEPPRPRTNLPHVSCVALVRPWWGVSPLPTSP